MKRYPSHPTKRTRHLGRGKRRKLPGGIHEIVPRTDADYQPTYYVGEYDRMHAAGWGEVLSRFPVSTS